MQKRWKLCLIISVCAGLLLAGLLMWMAWDHNPQCEIHCAEQGVDWGRWLALGAAGWLLGFFGCMLACQRVDTGVQTVIAGRAFLISTKACLQASKKPLFRVAFCKVFSE